MKLYVGNLPYQATETDVEGCFSELGITLDSVTVVRDRDSGQGRGFGFVEIEDSEQAEAAIQAANGKDLMGRPLVVNEARPRVPSGGGPRDFGDRRKGHSSKRGKRNRW